MSEAPKILLAHQLKLLKLPTFLREYEKMARQCAAEGLDHVQFLARLVELELIDRERRTIERRIKAANFPAVKSLDSFDFKAIPKLNKMQVLELARCEWIERRENVIALGPSGTGKTHVALALGLHACQKGLSVGFTTAAALVNALMEARDERRRVVTSHRARAAEGIGDLLHLGERDLWRHRGVHAREHEEFPAALLKGVGALFGHVRVETRAQLGQPDCP